MQLPEIFLESVRRRRPYPSPILAGTIPCPECGGNPLIRRHTPNWARLTQTEEPFDFRVGPCLMLRPLMMHMLLLEVLTSLEEDITEVPKSGAGTALAEGIGLCTVADLR